MRHQQTVDPLFRPLRVLHLILCFFCGAVFGAEHRPNIIFILADDLGYGDLGCYGQARIKTPNLDALASQGTRFTRFYAGSTVCAPSRCVLMTGLHTGHCTIRGNNDLPLLPTDTTVAKALQLAGYHTALIGKWGLGEPDSSGIPNRQGFDEFFGYLNQKHAHNYYPETLWRNKTEVPLEKNSNGARGEYTGDLFTAEALKYLRRRADEPNAPFFLYLAYTIPHANNELGVKTGNGMEVPEDAPYSGEDWPQAEKNFAAMITRMDAGIGQILKSLDDLGLAADTVVFFSSDNGPHHEGGHSDKFFGSSGKLRGCKRDLYEGGIRVPMLARWPGHVAAGAVSDQVCGFVDFLPTACEIAGAQPPADIDGISLVPALLRKARQNHEYLYWEFHEHGFAQSILMGDWKAVRNKAQAPIELYNLKEDESETRDIAAEHPDLTGQIQNLFKQARRESENWPVKSSP
ncbi:arylsulfatase [Candidatus Sumerlaeota bacterium]|nr:arylsulfatase [Candidatus Sumerlaeota bacterium]